MLVRSCIERCMEAGGILFGVNVGVGGSNLFCATNFKFAHELGCWTGQGTSGCILFQTGTGISDVKIAHGQLTDTIIWAKCGVFDTFHGKFFGGRSEEHTSELQSRFDLVCRLLLEKKKKDEIETS